MIGSGGAVGQTGGTTTAFSLSVNGGNSASGVNGGAGGSGGGGGGY